MAPLSEEQLAIRHTAVWASEMAAVCGVSPYDSPRSVWRAKLGIDPPKVQTEPMEIGTALEDAIAGLYARRRGVQLNRVGSLKHPLHDWIGATPDFRWTTGERNVQIKNVGSNSMHRWGNPEDGPDGVPHEVIVQTHCEMAVCGDSDCDVAALLGGGTLKIYRVEFDRELWEMLLAKAELFWGHCLTRIQPPISALQVDTDHVNGKFPRSNGELLHATPEMIDHAFSYHHWLEKEKEAKAGKALSGNRLRELLSEAEGCKFPGGYVAWRNDKNGDRSLSVKVRTD